MDIEKIIEVPTGHILVTKGCKGKLETVSMGDYGKDVNLNKDIRVTDDHPLLPLTDKWVVTISTQYGCSMGCQFCDVPRAGKGVNCTLHDLQGQVLQSLKLFPEVTYSNRLNVHYARMGEPTFNPNVLDHARWMKDHIDHEFNVHPVLTTMLPRSNEWLKTMIHAWSRIKNRVYHGNAGLQLSINSTNEDERKRIFSGNSITLLEASRLMDGIAVVGRKVVLNFPVCGWEIRADVLRQYFEPERFIVKLTPMHKTASSEKFGHETTGDYVSPEPYKKTEQELRDAGFDVLVFIASEDEDHGMITCGNALLAGVKNPRLRTGPLRFIGGSPIGRTPFIKWASQPDPYHTQLTEANVVA